MLPVRKQKNFSLSAAQQANSEPTRFDEPFHFLSLSSEKVSFGVENISLSSRVAPLIVLVVERSKFSYLYAGKCLAGETLMPIEEL